MIEYLVSLLSPFLKGFELRDTRLKRKSEVVSKLKAAIRLTEKHISETSKGEYDDVESEKLSKKWSEVAEAIRPFNDDLARVFEEKSDYWAYPLGFRKDLQSGKRRRDFRLRLTVVKQIAANLEKRWRKM